MFLTTISEIGPIWRGGESLGQTLLLPLSLGERGVGAIPVNGSIES